MVSQERIKCLAYFEKLPYNKASRMAAADSELRIERLEAALRMASRELQWATLTIQKKDAEIQLLQERLRKQRIGFLGPLSETLSDLQLELLADDEPGVTREEVEAESRREPILTAPPRKRKPHPGRKPLPESLPRVEEVIRCEANCTHCGGETRVIGYDLSEVLDREPAKWFVRVSKRENVRAENVLRFRCRRLRRALWKKGWPATG